jgi:hypothetical protein
MSEGELWKFGFIIFLNGFVRFPLYSNSQSYGIIFDICYEVWKWEGGGEVEISWMLFELVGVQIAAKST